MSSSFSRERLSCKNKSGFARLSESSQPVSCRFTSLLVLLWLFLLWCSICLPFSLPFSLRTYSLTLVSAIPPFHAALVASSRNQLVRNFQSYRPIIAYRVNLDIFFLFFFSQCWIWMHKGTKGKFRKKWIYVERYLFVPVEHYIFKLLLFARFCIVRTNIYFYLQWLTKILYSNTFFFLYFDFVFFVTKFLIRNRAEHNKHDFVSFKYNFVTLI